MRLAIASCLLLATSCSVPGVDELNTECGAYPNPNTLFPQGPADLIFGDGPGCRYIPVTVSFVGFTPGCIQLHVRGTEPDQEVIEQLNNPPARSRNVLVAVMPPASWGPEMDVEVRAFEQTCETAQVGLIRAGVTVPVDQVVPLSLSITAADDDGDGFVAITQGGTDCWDTRADVFPGATELCNGQDDDCDGLIDEGFSSTGSAPSGLVAYRDDDGDGYGAGAGLHVCGEPPAGYVLNNQDCNDTWPTVYPGAVELCDGRDNNCDGTIDEGYANLGATCMDANSQCMGTYQCAPQGDSTLCVASTPGPC
ncbi:hypothetical protein MFUL124B02_16110 [Myxococcus fulvus 124B02]|nr:hypothetical protein MFUL124B02_16110 [Myxococcus fulvus 124B02]